MNVNEIGVSVAELLVTVGFAKTVSEARRHIQGKGVKLNDLTVSDPWARLVTDEKGNGHVLEFIDKGT
jgi:tyrosyl-tRNA synthetase